MDDKCTDDAGEAPVGDFREQEIERLVTGWSADYLRETRDEIEDEIETTDNERDVELLEYRLGLVEDAINRLEDEDDEDG